MAPLDEANQVSGELALLLGNAIRQQDLELLRQVIREMAVTCPDLDARWAFRTVQRDLTSEQVAWFEAAIVQIRHPE
jgi:hypothetical protein